MKNKKVVYLAVSVLFIWGLVIYRIISSMKDSSKSTEFVVMANPNAMAIPTVDTFTLIANYRDPFLDGVKQAEDSAQQETSRIRRERAISEKDNVVWPDIQYGGIIKKQNTNQLIAFIKVNGQSYLAHANEEVGGVGILSVYRDSIRVEFKQARKSIKKN